MKYPEEESWTHNVRKLADRETVRALDKLWKSAATGASRGSRLSRSVAKSESETEGSKHLHLLHRLIRSVNNLFRVTES